MQVVKKVRKEKVRRENLDAEIRNRVTSLLHSSHFPAFRSFGIRVEQGAVTLVGKVQSYYEKQVAMTSCQHVAGVLSFIDEIEVNPTMDR